MSKRVLIVSHNALSAHANNGKTLASIFSSWDERDLAQLFFQDELPGTNLRTNYFRLRDLDVIHSGVKYRSRASAGTVVTTITSTQDHYASSHVLKRSAIALLRRLNVVKRLLRDMIYGDSITAYPKLVSWVREFNPDSIFFLGGDSIFSFRFALALSKYFNVPLDIYLTDDYVLTPRSGNILVRMYRARLLEQYKSVFRQSRHAFAIGDSMCKAFRECFGRDFLPIMNAVVFPERVPDRGSPSSKDLLDIVYAGGLHLGRHDTIALLSRVLMTACQNQLRQARISVYSAARPRSREVKKLIESGVFFGGFLNAASLRERLSRADICLHVESFDTKFGELTKFSISTKLPEYFSAGVCVLAIGPEELASISLISDNDLGFCMTDLAGFNDYSQHVIGRIFSDRARSEYASKAFEFGKSRFDKERVSGEFHSLLNG